jgi:hypothetical protein
MRSPVRYSESRRGRRRGVRDWRLVHRLLRFPQGLWCRLAHRPMHKLREVQHVSRVSHDQLTRREDWRCRVCGRRYTRVRRLKQ